MQQADQPIPTQKGGNRAHTHIKPVLGCFEAPRPLLVHLGTGGHACAVLQGQGRDGTGMGNR